MRQIIFSKIEGRIHRSVTLQENGTVFFQYQDVKTFKSQGVAFSIDELDEIIRSAKGAEELLLHAGKASQQRREEK